MDTHQLTALLSGMSVSEVERLFEWVLLRLERDDKDLPDDFEFLAFACAVKAERQARLMH